MIKEKKIVVSGKIVLMKIDPEFDNSDINGRKLEKLIHSGN